MIEALDLVPRESNSVAAAVLVVTRGLLAGGVGSGRALASATKLAHDLAGRLVAQHTLDRAMAPARVVRSISGWIVEMADRARKHRRGSLGALIVTAITNPETRAADLDALRAAGLTDAEISRLLRKMRYGNAAAVEHQLRLVLSAEAHG